MAILQLKGCPRRKNISGKQHRKIQINAAAPRGGGIEPNEQLQKSCPTNPDHHISPGSNPPASGLRANNTLIREDGNTIENDFEIVQHYIVKNTDIWVPDNKEVRLYQSSPNRLYVISREGPEWEIDSKVNVGLKIKNLETGAVFWLSVSGVPIVETS